MNQTRVFLIVAWLMVATLLWMEWGKEKSAPAQPATTSAQTDAAPAGEPQLRLVNGDGVGYTVPQRIRTQRVEKGVDVFFRVRRIYKDSVIRVMDGDVQLAQFKREHMAPGEMEHIVLPKVILDRAKTGTVTVLAADAVRQ